jgi:hypothetical protein
MATCHTRVSWKGVSEGAAALLSAVELPSPSKFAAKHKAANPLLLSAYVQFLPIPVPSPHSYHKRRLVLIGQGNYQCSCVYHYLLLKRFVTCHRIFDTKSDISVSFGTQMRRPSLRHRCSNKEACSEMGQPLHVHVSHFLTRTHSDFKRKLMVQRMSFENTIPANFNAFRSLLTDSGEY